MNEERPPTLETDPRFPSGPWVGFFLQKQLPGKHMMELRLTFVAGKMAGEGRDWVGQFVIKGRYDTADGKCYWTKKYLGKHDVFYHGYNEGKGIWGTWEIGELARGGFYIWPEGLDDPTNSLSTRKPICRCRKKNRLRWASPPDWICHEISERESNRPPRHLAERRAAPRRHDAGGKRVGPAAGAARATSSAPRLR